MSKSRNKLLVLPECRNINRVGVFRSGRAWHRRGRARGPIRCRAEDPRRCFRNRCNSLRDDPQLPTDVTMGEGTLRHFRFCCC